MTSARCCLIRAPHTIRPPRSAIAQFVWPADRIITDHRHGFHIRCTAGAERDLHGWIRSSRRLRGPRVETGGLLFGQFDEFLKIAWVTEVSGPPPDSRASAEGFLCGVAGATELSEEKRARTRGSVSFIGMWHTHPGSIPSPSCTDFSAMSKLRESPSSTPRHFLMLILGGHMESPQFEGFVFARSDER
jgi:integrative and conjugative element protein (TIGR02256 family)